MENDEQDHCNDCDRKNAPTLKVDTKAPAAATSGFDQSKTQGTVVLIISKTNSSNLLRKGRGLEEELH